MSWATRAAKLRPEPKPVPKRRRGRDPRGRAANNNNLQTVEDSHVQAAPLEHPPSNTQVDPFTAQTHESYHHSEENQYQETQNEVPRTEQPLMEQNEKWDQNYDQQWDGQKQQFAEYTDPPVQEETDYNMWNQENLWDQDQLDQADDFVAEAPQEQIQPIQRNEVAGNDFQYEDKFQYADPNFQQEQNYAQEQTYVQEQPFAQQEQQEQYVQYEHHDARIQVEVQTNQETNYEQQYNQEAPQQQFEQEARQIAEVSPQFETTYQEAPQPAAPEQETPPQYQQTEPTEPTTEQENFPSTAPAQAAPRTDLHPLDFTSIPVPNRHQIPPPGDALHFYAGNYTATFKFLPTSLPSEEYAPLEYANEQQKEPENYQENFEEPQYQDGNVPSGYESPQFKPADQYREKPVEMQTQPQAPSWQPAQEEQHQPIPSPQQPVQEILPEAPAQVAPAPEEILTNSQAPVEEEKPNTQANEPKPTGNVWSRGRPTMQNKRDLAKRKGPGPNRTRNRAQPSTDKKRASPSKRTQKKLTKEQLEKKEKALKELAAFEKSQPKPPKGQLIRGLPNAGVHCYVNSLVQALVATPRFRNFFATLPAEIACGLGEFTKSMAKFVSGFTSDNFKGAKQGGVANFDLIKPLVEKFESMQGDGQQDVAEFYSFLVSKLHNELLYTRSSPEKKDTSSETTEEESEWVKVGPKRELTTTVSTPTNRERSLMDSVFGGVLRSVLSTRGKAVKSDKFEPFFSIQLSVADKVNSIDDALRAYLAKESMVLSRQKGGRKTKAAGSKRIEFGALPNCLVLELKRWVNTGSGYSKNAKRITFNAELLINRRYLSTRDQNCQYALRSIIVHSGEGVTKGHYTVYSWFKETGWLLINDDKIVSVSWSDVAKEDPYMLMYEKSYRVPYS